MKIGILGSGNMGRSLQTLPAATQARLGGHQTSNLN